MRPKHSGFLQRRLGSLLSTGLSRGSLQRPQRLCGDVCLPERLVPRPARGRAQEFPLYFNGLGGRTAESGTAGEIGPGGLRGRRGLLGTAGSGPSSQNLLPDLLYSTYSTHPTCSTYVPAVPRPQLSPGRGLPRLCLGNLPAGLKARNVLIAQRLRPGDMIIQYRLQ